jgi:hypothetical protein
MGTRGRFLAFLWLFVACDFILFQNFNQDASAVDIHNDQCKQALQINQSRIMNTDAVSAGLIAAWPAAASSDPRPMIRSMTSILLDANTQIYQTCLSTAAVRGSQTLALTELQALSNPDSNAAWKRYIAALENGLATLSGGTQ